MIGDYFEGEMGKEGERGNSVKGIEKKDSFNSFYKIRIRRKEKREIKIKVRT